MPFGREHKVEGGVRPPGARKSIGPTLAERCAWGGMVTGGATWEDSGRSVVSTVVGGDGMAAASSRDGGAGGAGAASGWGIALGGVFAAASREASGVPASAARDAASMGACEDAAGSTRRRWARTISLTRMDVRTTPSGPRSSMPTVPSSCGDGSAGLRAKR